MFTIAYTPYMWPLLIATLIAVGLGQHAWRNRQINGATSFGLLITCIGVWVLCYMLEILSVEPAAKIFWLKAKYLGLAPFPVVWLAFALQYSGREQLLTRANFALPIGIAAFNMLMAFTNDSHQLFWTEIWVGADGIQRVTHGSLFWVSVAFNYVLFLGGAILLALMWLRAERIYRRQIGVVLLGTFVPLVGNALTLLGVSPFPGLDLTPFAFTLTGMAVGWSLFRFQFLDIVPVAYEAIVKSMRDGVLVLDQQQRIVVLNPPAEFIIGGSAREIVGKPASEVLTEWPDLVAQYRNVTEVHTEITLGSGDERRIYELDITPLKDRRGRYTGRLVVVHDITERVQAAEERERLIRELDAFAHTVAHDLKNPLGITMSYAQLLTSEHFTVEPEKTADTLQIINRNARKMNNIIDELLLLASVRKLDEIQRKPLDMTTIVQEAQERLERMIEECAATIVLPDTWPTAEGHAPWVEEVITNYLSNALKYGGDPPHVEFGADPDHNGMVRFWVRDNGPGIPEEHQEVIFNQFTRLDETRAEGHGLGLSIVQRIVDKLGGEVGVQSTPGAGCTFSFTLPAAKEAVNKP
jgi:PAS domain S-box-containing protein